MKTLLFALLISVILVSGCKKKGTDESTRAESEADPVTPAEHEKQYGLKCTWATKDSSNTEVICIGDGYRYFCIRGNCATSAR